MGFEIMNAEHNVDIPSGRAAVALANEAPNQFSAELSNALLAISILILFIFACTSILGVFLFIKNKIFKNNLKTPVDIGDVHQNKIIEEESRINYYKFVREEISREDEITNQRLTWSMAIQGFLIASLTANLSFGWNNDLSGFKGIIIARCALFLVIGLSGFTFAFITYLGILGARRSIDFTKAQWEKRNAIWEIYPNYVPQPCGQDKAFNFGRWYALGIPIAFMLIWVTEVVCFVLILNIKDAI